MSVEESVKPAFLQIAGEDGEIDAEELLQVLNYNFKKGTDHRIAMESPSKICCAIKGNKLGSVLGPSDLIIV